MNEKVIDFTVGADPEFACTKRGEIVNAIDWVASDSSMDFGCDGNEITFELRPAPSKSPLQIVTNIRDIFVRQVIREPEFLKFKWVAGSWHKGYPLGGHIHFGLSEEQIRHRIAVEYLDHYVGSLSLLLEKRSDALKRREDSYGAMGDMRGQPWGFEYRPMSSWLSTPYIAAAMLCLSKTVMYEVMNNSKFDWHKFVTSRDFKDCNQERLREIFPQIWNDITKMYLYQSYKPYIDLLHYLIKNNLSWLNSNDLKDCWGIVDMKPCVSEKISVDVLWTPYNLEQANAQ